MGEILQEERNTNADEKKERTRKIIGYDRYTGAPVYEEKPPVPVQNKAGNETDFSCRSSYSKSSGYRYDPQTGKPLQRVGKPGEAGGYRFDPQTGKPLQRAEKPEEVSGYHFDPQTGKPLQRAGKAEEAGGYRFDPQTGRPLQSGRHLHNREVLSGNGVKIRNRGIKGLIISGIAVAALAIGIRFYLGQPYIRVARAAGKTFVADDLTKKLSSLSKICKDGSYHLSFDYTLPSEFESVNGDFTVLPKDYTFSGSYRDYDDTTMVSLKLDDAYLYISSSDADNSFDVKYPYTTDKTGTNLIQYVNDYSDIDTDELDQKISDIHDDMSVLSDFPKVNVRKELLDLLKSMDLKKEKSQNIRLDEKMHRCSVYSASFTKEDIADYLSENMEEIRKVLNIFSTIDSDDIDLSAADGDDILAMLDEEGLENLNGKVYFYLYKDRLVRIDVQTGRKGGIATVVFAGNKIPWYKTQIVVTGEGFDINSQYNLLDAYTVDKGTVSYTITSPSDPDTKVEVIYHSKSGEFSLRQDGEEIANGTYKADKSGSSISLSDSTGDMGGMSLNLVIDEKKNNPYDGKNAVDLSEMSLEDLYQLSDSDLMYEIENLE